MKNTICKNQKNKILLVIILLVLALVFSVIWFIYKKSAHDDFYINGQEYDGQLLYGVVGTGNLFEPNKEITVVIDCKKSDFVGEKTIVKITTEQSDFKKEKSIIFDQSQIVSFTPTYNGIYTIEFETPDNITHSFNIAVMPKNEMANDEFYYGIQPYLSRAYLWGEGFCLPNYDYDKSIDLMLDAAEYMGINLVREDNVSWAMAQKEPYGNTDFKHQDYIVDKVNSRGMKLNLIFGFNADKWSADSVFQDNYDESRGWTYAPDPDYWKDYVTKVADHYKNNTDILWEIWNEPNWNPFFTGDKEQYFNLLEIASKAFKSANNNSYVFTGGLAVANRSSNLPYYEKSAELINKGYLDNYGYHNHDGFDTYYATMSEMLAVTNSVNLSGGINSESGSYNAAPELLVCKALYTRATGAKGFVSFSFRKSVTPENDINDFAYFDEYLQPTEAVVAYSTVIRFLGRASFEQSISSEQDLQIDHYEKDGKKILVYYSLGNTTNTLVPTGNYTAYNMYGNEIEVENNIDVSTQPIYFIFE